MWVRFPPFPPSRCGREVRRGPEKPVTYVRFVAAAPKFYAGGRLVARTGDCGSPDVGSTPIHRTNLASAAGMASNRSGVIGSANCRKVLQGVRLAVSRQPLKLASGVRLAHPLPLAVRSAARTADSDSANSGSSPLPPTKVSCARRSTD